jgi:hypothetical protein
MKEPVVLGGVIVGGERRVECKIRATKITTVGDPAAPPVFCDYRVMKSNETNALPDGDYEILTNGQTIKVKLKNERFVARF